jgi:hypothetical protein
MVGREQRPLRRCAISAALKAFCHGVLQNSSVAICGSDRQKL